VFIPGSTVLRVVRRGRVQGTPISDADGKPLGVELHGVGGSGLRDGDVVTHVDGVRVFSPDAAVDVITRGLARKAKSITGVVLRGSQRIDVVVEVPSEATAPQGSK
jgi:hypothetical protein